MWVLPDELESPSVPPPPPPRPSPNAASPSGPRWTPRREAAPTSAGLRFGRLPAGILILIFFLLWMQFPGCMNSLAGPLAGRDTPSSSGSTGFETPDGTLNLEVGSQPPALVGELYQVAGWTNLDTRELSSGATQVLLLEDAYSSSSSNSGRIALATFSGSHGSLEWISDPIAVGKDELRVVSGESTVFAIGDGVLSALDRDTGELNWHETIGSPWWEAATADDVLAVQLSSGEVRAWRGTDGVEPWSRPVATNTRMLSVDGYLLLASSPLPDAQGATSQAIDVATVDPLSGGTVATVALKCPAAQAVTSWDFMTVLLRVPGSEDVVAVGGESAPCLTRWNPMTGRTVWTVTAKGRLPNGLTGDAILSRSHAVLASRFESAVASIDLATGEVHNFEQPDGWAIILHAFARGIVVARDAHEPVSECLGQILDRHFS